ncbi:hypothetical protein LTR53_016726 [Teratosphaeriaceae sp. CCFEE 6253]|nr:hypothetical protein LTR53_016726 [Teratosphaeriaceae sp. CCFEE 6253]
MGGVEGSSDVFARSPSPGSRTSLLERDQGYLSCLQGKLQCVNDARPASPLLRAKPLPRTERESMMQGWKAQKTLRRS